MQLVSGLRLCFLGLGVVLLSLCAPAHAFSSNTKGSTKSEPERTGDTSEEIINNTNTILRASLSGNPVRRHVGSVARQGSLPGYHGKRMDDDTFSRLPASRLEEQLDAIKSYLDGLVKEGKIPCSSPETNKVENDPRSEPRDDDFDFSSAEETPEELNEDQQPVDKRHIGSLARNGALREFAARGRRFLSFSAPNPGKRHLGSVRAGSLTGSTSSRMTGKRFLGSLARAGQLPYRLKRSLTDEFFPFADEDEATVDYSEDYPDENPEMREMDFPKDLRPSMEKKHIGSVARAGWVPYHVASRRVTTPVPERAYRRHYKRRPSPSLSGRLRLLYELQQIERNHQANQQPEPQYGDWRPMAPGVQQAFAAQDTKRNIASLARNGMLPSSYRMSRSAGESIPLNDGNAPPVARLVANRFGPAYPVRRSGYLKAPHAFVSLHSDAWRRFKRSISSIARQGKLRSTAPSPAYPDANCDTVPGRNNCDPSSEVDKRHMGSVVRAKQLPFAAGKRREDDASLEESLYDAYPAAAALPETSEGVEDESKSQDDESFFPYPEIIF